MSKVTLTDGTGYHTAYLTIGWRELVIRFVLLLIWTIMAIMVHNVKSAGCQSTPYRTERRGRVVIACVIVDEGPVGED